MNEIARRDPGALQRSPAGEPGVDPASYSWSTGGESGQWGWLEHMPAEVTASLRSQGLWPEDLFIGNPHGPEAGLARISAGYRQEAGGWIVAPNGLIQFDAARDAVRIPGASGLHPAVNPVGPWRVTGTLTPFSDRARVATKVVPLEPMPTESSASTRKGRWIGPGALRYAETLPATARAKLLAVVSPTLADSHITRLHSIPGIYGFVVLAVAANSTELVAVQGRKYIEARGTESEASADARLASTGWELTILRGIFREQVEAR
jgi:hypothetical protein